MIEYKRISFKYVVMAFLIAACLIILLSIDRKNNEALKFIKYLNKIGYSVKNLSKNKKFKLVKSFQRRFRQKLVNGKIDRECLIIGKKLSKLS